jgi:hypothetical protein
VILGVFLIAFFAKPVKGTAVFLSALIGECIVLALFLLNEHNIIDLGFLWLNAVGAIVVFSLGWLLQLTFLNRKPVSARI